VHPVRDGGAIGPIPRNAFDGPPLQGASRTADTFAERAPTIACAIVAFGDFEWPYGAEQWTER
jgi:hypothetical protein